MCYQLLKEPHILTPAITFSPKSVSNPLISEDALVQTEFLRLIPTLSLDTNIKHPEWVKIQNSSVCKETFVMVTFDTERPLFGRVFDLLCYDSTILVHVQVYVGEYFISHYNAFIIRCHGEFSALNIFTLQDHRPAVVKSSFNGDRELYVFLPYYY